MNNPTGGDIYKCLRCKMYSRDSVREQDMQKHIQGVTHKHRYEKIITQ